VGVRTPHKRADAAHLGAVNRIGECKPPTNSGIAAALIDRSNRDAHRQDEPECRRVTAAAGPNPESPYLPSAFVTSVTITPTFLTAALSWSEVHPNFAHQ